MKQRVLFIGIVCLLGIYSVSAQNEHKDYFSGKWDVMVYGTSKGDQRMIIELKRINGKLSGAIVGPTDDVKPFKKIEETANTVKLTFKYFLFNVNLFLQKKDEVHVVGNLQGDYKANGVRMK